MVYQLLKDIEQYMSGKESLTAIEKSIIIRAQQLLQTLRNVEDSELLRQNEIIVRICPATNAPVLACYDGENMCSCLHNDTVEEDAVDVKQWISSAGNICTGNQRLLEAVADIAYNAGAENICDGNDSRMVIDNVIDWAREFEQENATNDWREDDYILAIDGFYREKSNDFKQQVQ